VGPGGGASINGSILALAVQADNSVIAGGDFTSFNGQVHNHLIRFNSAGVIDPTFNPGTGSSAENSVRVIAIQPDGRILIGGSFTNVIVSNVTYNFNYLARLNTDGSVDTNFDVGAGGDNSVLALAIDSQENILVGGEFTRFSGVTRSGITRLLGRGRMAVLSTPSLFRATANLISAAASPVSRGLAKTTSCGSLAAP
jgi:uncharacterized delta-60 repeat protein